MNSTTPGSGVRATPADWQISAIADKHRAECDGQKVLDEVSFARELLSAYGVKVVGTAATHPPCTVCGTAYEKHGSYPTCASHPYSPDGRCGHVGIFADGRFTGVPCAGAECRNGCARASGVNPSDGGQPK